MKRMYKKTIVTVLAVLVCCQVVLINKVQGDSGGPMYAGALALEIMALGLLAHDAFKRKRGGRNAGE